MPKTARPKKKKIEPYEQLGKNGLKNPPVELVNADFDQDLPRKTYAYDPHMDPSLQWAGKAERASFEVPTVFLQVLERIDPRTIIEARPRREEKKVNYKQLSLFHTISENPSMREEIEFYKHKHDWNNRLVAGDSLLVMNSLLEKEGLGGQVQMIYIDPSNDIQYGSNFQPFVNKCDGTDGKDEDLNQKPEMVKAFRDTWELGIHSYPTYYRDRLLLARELLNQSGSIFMQTNTENSHIVAALLDEIFGPENFIADIIIRKRTLPPDAKYLETMHDHILFYAKNKEQLKYRQLFEENDVSQFTSHGPFALFPDNSWKKISIEEFKSPVHPKGTRYYRLVSLIAPSYSKGTDFRYSFEGKSYPPPGKGAWVVNKENLNFLSKIGRIQPEGESLSYRLFYDDFPFKKVTNFWLETATSFEKKSVVQTTPSVVTRCMLMTTDPGDIVFDPACGSGTTAFVAEQWGRRWITCDKSLNSITLAKQKIMTALFDYYELARPEEGIGGGFIYKGIPHIKMESLINNETPKIETLYDQPIPDKSRARVTGPFTVEAVPAPVVRSPGELLSEPVSDAPIDRKGGTPHQAQWSEKLLQTGVRIIFIIVGFIVVLLVLKGLIIIGIRKWGPTNSAASPIPLVAQSRSSSTSTYTSIFTTSPGQTLTFTPMFTPLDTPIAPTKTSTTVANGSGIVGNCIVKSIWDSLSYVTDRNPENDCWDFSTKYGFFARDGHIFVAPMFQDDKTVYGISRSMSENIRIEFTITITELRNAQIWMGIFDEGYFDLARNGLSFSQSETGGILSQLIVKGILDEDYKEVVSTNQPRTIVLDFKLPQMSIYLKNDPSNPITSKPIVLKYNKPIFWIGANSTGLPDSHVQVEIALRFEQR